MRASGGDCSHTTFLGVLSYFPVCDREIALRSGVDMDRSDSSGNLEKCPRSDNLNVDW
jgi:hypothetical protein